MRVEETVMQLRLLIGLLLAFITLALYWPALDSEFVHYDDPSYVTENTHVRTGLSRENVRWAFTNIHDGNWIPLCWLSLMLDAQLFGLEARGFHLTNVLLHAANTLLLFAALWQMTGAVWKSAVAAALFAVHPLHVESVAWVAERKDVLSTFFGFLALWAYARYVRLGGTPRAERWAWRLQPRPSKTQSVPPDPRQTMWYVISLAAFVLSLASKQMLVTLPLVLLLLDYWPLGRFGISDKTGERGASAPWLSQRPADTGRSPFSFLDAVGEHWRRLLVEKVPFFALTALFCVVAFLAQRGGGAVLDFEELPPHVRVFNVVLVYAIYIRKAVWPYDLAFFYPHPGRAISMVHVTAAALLLVLLTSAAVRQARRRPYLLVGWLWYLGTLIPVIGLVQIGNQQMADRYTYVPLCGLIIAVTWLVPSLVPAGRWSERIQLASAALILCALTAVSWRQIGTWRNDFTLYERALAVNDNNSPVHNSMGVWLVKRGRRDLALEHFRRAVDISPDFIMARQNLASAHSDVGSSLALKGRLTEAITHFRLALDVDPEHVLARYNLANALCELGELDEARKHYLQVLAIDPESADAHNALGLLYLRQEKRKPAIERFREALRLDPGFRQARQNLRRALTE